MCVHGENLDITDVGFLPFFSAYAVKMGLVEQIDGLLDCEMEVGPGRIVLAVVFRPPPGAQ